jgi:tRNA (guanine-N7-)-methyltransferase
MRVDSSVPTSAQTGIHEQLGRSLERHAASRFLKPYADHNRRAFDDSMARWRDTAPEAPLILDSGCGVGESSLHLAREFPEHYVIGVDQSASRLSRNIAAKRAGIPGNLDLVRADLVDYWRLFEASGIHLARHYLLYPNPWPKIGQLSRRWHGHPVFPQMIRLGGLLECRSNWAVYIDEFCFAVNRLTGVAAERHSFVPDRVMTPFERKYLVSGHVLYRTVVELSGQSD